MPITAELRYFDYGPDGNTQLGYGEKGERRHIYILCSSVPNSHMTFGMVDTDEDDPLWPEKIPVARWKFLSRHDTCWTDAIRHFCNEIYFAMCRRVVDHVADVHQPAPVALNHFHNLGCFGGRLWFPCNITYRKTGDYNYQILKCEMVETQTEEK